MIDYILIRGHAEPLDTLHPALERHLSEWTSYRLCDELLLCYCRRPSSQFQFRVNGNECLIGVDFQEIDPEMGAYIHVSWATQGEVVVRRDPTGIIPCWVRSVAGFDIFFSRLSDVAQPFGIPLEIDWEFIRYHLCAPSTRGKRTGIADIYELLPGWQATLSEGAIVLSSWWALHRGGDRYATVEQAKTAIREAAGRAVGIWARKYGSVALTLSGGLDSAIVLGLLKLHAPKVEITAVNYLVSHVEGDERAYAEAVTRHNGVSLRVEKIQQEGLYFDLSEGAGRLRPSNYVIPLGYRQVRNSIANELGPEAIFSGTGGDHLFHEAVSPAVVSDAIRDGQPIGAIAGIAHQHAFMARETLWSMLYKGARTHLARPNLDELISVQNTFLTVKAESDIDWSEIVHPDIDERSRAIPVGKMKQATDILELQEHYWRYGSNFPTDEVHPLISVPMLQVSMRVPTYFFSYGGVRRGLARAAFQDIIPDVIKDRRGKGANTSHWINVMIQNLPFLRNLMLNGELVRRGYVDQGKLDRTLTPLGLAGKADFPGLTTCVATEIWIQQILGGYLKSRIS